ncbi:MAG: hypothetical protein GXY86_03415 [Firmicutes bacterium]|nr:hypothetical protein [Bacillota bacterium]
MSLKRLTDNLKPIITLSMPKSGFSQRILTKCIRFSKIIRVPLSLVWLKIGNQIINPASSNQETLSNNFFSESHLIFNFIFPVTTYLSNGKFQESETYFQYHEVTRQQQVLRKYFHEKTKLERILARNFKPVIKLIKPKSILGGYLPVKRGLIRSARWELTNRQWSGQSFTLNRDKYFWAPVHNFRFISKYRWQEATLNQSSEYDVSDNYLSTTKYRNHSSELRLVSLITDGELFKEVSRITKRQWFYPKPTGLLVKRNDRYGLVHSSNYHESNPELLEQAKKKPELQLQDILSTVPYWLEMKPNQIKAGIVRHETLLAQHREISRKLWFFEGLLKLKTRVGLYSQAPDHLPESVFTGVTDRINSGSAMLFPKLSISTGRFRMETPMVHKKEGNLEITAQNQSVSGEIRQSESIVVKNEPSVDLKSETETVREKDINLIAAKVYRMLEKRIAVEKDRRGLS